MVESQPSKLVMWVRFPSPALRLTVGVEHTIVCCFGSVLIGFGDFEIGLTAAVAQSVECVLGKDEVKGSNPFSSFALGF